MIPTTKFKLNYTRDMLDKPCLIIGPGLEPLFWAKSLANALAIYDGMQQIIFCQANDLQREHFGVPKGAFRVLIKAIFGDGALTDPPYLDEVWKRLREEVEFNAPGTPLHCTYPSQWDSPVESRLGINNPRAPAKVRRYVRILKRKGDS